MIPKSFLSVKGVHPKTNLTNKSFYIFNSRILENLTALNLVEAFTKPHHSADFKKNALSFLLIKSRTNVYVLNIMCKFVA